MSQEQYDTVCKEQFEHIKKKLVEIHNRLFIDNGRPSMQTRQDRTERILKIVVWIVCIVAATSLAQITNKAWTHLATGHQQTVEK